MSDLHERERALLREYESMRMGAPNPRDFRSWNDFYVAQAEHERKLAALEDRIEEVRREAWA